MFESRSTDYPSRRAVLAMLTGTLASPLARSEVYHEPHLAHDEAILIYRTDFPSLKELIFWRVDARGSFMARDLGRAPMVVKAGWYFLRSYTTMYTNLTADIFPEPKGREDAIELISGAVSYIGDVIGTLTPDGAPAFNVKIEIRRETLVKARDLSPWLEKYPLFVSMQGREPTPMSWLDVR
jgi:hypothetical protein